MIVIPLERSDRGIYPTGMLLCIKMLPIDGRFLHEVEMTG